MITEDHDVTVYRERDGIETEIRCLVQITLEGSRLRGWRVAGVDFEPCGELPDGSATDLDAAETEELASAADDIRRQRRSEIADGEADRYGD